MYEHIIEWIDDGNYQDALAEIDNIQNQEPTDTIAILEATVYERLGDTQNFFNTLQKGLAYNPHNGELHYMLGNYYNLYNIDQAYLCFQNAAHYLPAEEDRQMAQARMSELSKQIHLDKKQDGRSGAGQKFLIYQVNSPYGALQYFMNNLLSSFHALGINTTIVNLEEDNVLETILQLSEDKFDAVLSFNCFISSIKLSNGSFLQDYIQAPYYYFLLDHPMHHHNALKEKLHNFHALCVDNYFVEYIQNYYPHIRSVHTVYHGGCCQRTPVAYGNRNIDVLFTGTYKPCDKLLQLMQDSEEPANRISIALAEEILSHPELRQDEAFTKVLQKLGITLTNEEFSEWLSVVGNLVDHYIRGIYRNRLLETMAGQDYRVEVYGEGWEQCTIQADNIHFHPAVSFEENLKLMNQSKIVINTYTGFKSGAHERVFSAMLSKAICLSERNGCLEELFSENQEIIFFDYSHLEDLNSILYRYLSDIKLAEQITECAYQTAASQHTWNERAQQIVSLCTG